MTFSVYQHWDPLKVCVVGRSYPPEFYHWISVPHVRSLFEKIAIETEEDYQNIINKLSQFGVNVLRPDISESVTTSDGKFYPPPMTPRDYMIAIGDKFYVAHKNWQKFYAAVRDPTWPNAMQLSELPDWIQKECIEVHGWSDTVDDSFQRGSYKKIFEHIKQQGTAVCMAPVRQINGAMVSRLGKDLYFGTETYDQDQLQLQTVLDQEFLTTRNHIVNTGGHGDGTYCPVCPGLIISLKDVKNYADTFPGWEVVYLPNQSWSAVRPFLQLKQKNKGKWWIPGFEHDQDVVNIVESWLGHWTGYVEETVFDVNMLIIDPKNVMVFNYNKTVFDALERYGITPHVVPFRHRYFWDGGIHCVTTDLHREGTQQNFFPERD
jgi:hypothetical protein